MRKIEADRCMRLLEELDYLIEKAFSDAVAGDCKAVATGLSIAMELLEKMKDDLESDPFGRKDPYQRDPCCPVFL